METVLDSPYPESYVVISDTQRITGEWKEVCARIRLEKEFGTYIEKENVFVKWIQDRGGLEGIMLEAQRFQEQESLERARRIHKKSKRKLMTKMLVAGTIILAGCLTGGVGISLGLAALEAVGGVGDAIEVWKGPQVDPHEKNLHDLIRHLNQIPPTPLD